MHAHPDGSPARHRPVVSYDTRPGRLTAGQRRAWQRWWPSYGRDAAGLARLDFDEWFGRSAPVVLEIGSGMGEATAAMAAAEPELSHLAIEVYQPGLAQLLMRIREAGMDNVRLLRGDAVSVLREWIEPDTLAGIRIFFPDPWPKTRHHKRRLVQPDFVRLAASRLAPGATLHLATDWADYAEQMRTVCAGEPSLRATGPDRTGVIPRPPWRPMTKFELRAREEGRPVWDLRYERAMADAHADQAAADQTVADRVEA
jgi:tRNA (guanine-N7-)-methyltransferase